MVGYNPGEKVQLSHTENALAGAVSGAVTRAACQPLDVLKIRFQLQIEPVKKHEGSKYHGLIQAINRIIKEEGVFALWKGHVPAQVLSISYGFVQYGAFEVLTQISWNYLPHTMNTTYRPLTHTLCGFTSGCLATFFIQPADVIRTRFIAQGEPKVYTSSIHACQSIMKADGVMGFYRGLLPALTLVGPQMGLHFGLYSFLTSLWNSAISKPIGNVTDSFQSLICGSGSGVISKLIVYPLDVIKKRLQIQGFEEARHSFGAIRRYTGPVNCMMCIFREEGTRGFFKGLGPSLVKSGAVAGLNFTIYELVRNALISHHSNRTS